MAAAGRHGALAVLAAGYLLSRGGGDTATGTATGGDPAGGGSLQSSQPVDQPVAGDGRAWEASPQARTVHDVLVAAQAGDVVGVERFVPAGPSESFNYTAIDERAPAWQPNWDRSNVV